MGNRHVKQESVASRSQLDSKGNLFAAADAKLSRVFFGPLSPVNPALWHAVAVRDGQNPNDGIANDIGELVRKHTQIHAAAASVAEPRYFGIF
jgi:hypothetical protein